MINRQVRFRNIDAFVFAQDVEIDVPGYGSKLKVDISYGGSFFAFIPAKDLGKRSGLDSVIHRMYLRITQCVSGVTPNIRTLSLTLSLNDDISKVSTFVHLL